MRKIGIIGLGIMGHGMAVNFLKNNCEVAVWNRTSAKAKDLVSLGAKLLQSPKEVTNFADIIFDVVSDDEVSREVWFGQDGILRSATKEKVLIASATLSLDYIDELISATKTNGLKFLDIPLTGSRAGAETGTLKFLAGGDKQTLDSIRLDLEMISSKIYYFGKAGSGMRFKLILNMLTAIHALVASHAAILSLKSGLSPTEVKEAIMDGMPPSSPVTGQLFDSLEQSQEQTRFSIELFEKDLRYVQKMAKKYQLNLNLLNDTQKDFAKAKELGFGEKDWSAIVGVIRSDENYGD